MADTSGHYKELPQTDDEDLNSGSGYLPSIDEAVDTTNGTFTSPTPDVTCASSTYKASITILIVVSVVAILVLILFALATLRYRFGNKGSYYVAEFKKGKVQKNWTPDGATSDNVFDQPSTKEFML